MVCRTWSQPDGNHLRGLCTNELFSESGGTNCSICIHPIGITPGTCGCPLPLKPRMVHYLRVAWIVPPEVESCASLDPIGDFVITGCGGGYSSEDVTTFNVGAPPGTPPCVPYTDVEVYRVKRYRVLIGESYYSVLDGLRYASVEVEYRRRTAVWAGSSIASYIDETPYKWDGVIAACDNNRGSAQLLQWNTLENPTHAGLFPPTIRAILSTEPFI